MTVINRKNGYYPLNDKWVPSVSKILSSAGDSQGLIKWAAKHGGLGVLWALSKYQSNEKLLERMGNSASIEWASEQALAGLEEEGGRSRDFGSRVHNAIEAYLTNQPEIVTLAEENEKIAYETFKTFYKEVGIVPLAVEEEVLSPYYRYGGRVDLTTELTEEHCKKITPYLTNSSDDINPGFTVTDFKTGKMYPKKMSAQLSSYGIALRDQASKLKFGGLIINIERDAPSKVKCHYFNYETLTQAFYHGFMSAYRTWEFFDAPKWFDAQFTERTGNATS